MWFNTFNRIESGCWGVAGKEGEGEEEEVSGGANVMGQRERSCEFWKWRDRVSAQQHLS